MTNVAVLDSSDRKQEAFDFVRSLLERESQEFFTSSSKEYPLARGAEPDPTLDVPLAELALPSLALDLDDEADLRAFLTGPGDGPRTRALLAELGVRPAGAPRSGAGEEAQPGARENFSCAPGAGVSEIFLLEQSELFSKPHLTDKI